MVLTTCGGCLLFGFTITTIATRPPGCLVSRALFTALTSALLVVSRLLADLAEPFNAGSSYTLATDNAAGAILAPTRRRLVAALTRHHDEHERRHHEEHERQSAQDHAPW